MILILEEKATDFIRINFAKHSFLVKKANMR